LKIFAALGSIALEALQAIGYYQSALKKDVGKILSQSSGEND
jgi:hypothetical protein